MALPAAEAADELLVCVTAPPSPGLPIRTDTFVFEGATWVEVAEELEQVVRTDTVPGICLPGGSLGREGLEAFQETKHVHIETKLEIKDWWYPYG